MEELEKDEIRKIAYNCRKATYLIEKKQSEEITLREKLELKIHMAGCSVCRVFEKQSEMINHMVKNLFHTEQAENRLLDEEFKKNLQEQIEKRIDNKR